MWAGFAAARHARGSDGPEIAGQIGLSRMHVSRLLRRALAKLEAAAEGRPYP